MVIRATDDVKVKAATVTFWFCFEMDSHYIAQAGLKLSGQSDRPA
jgi:hypothetical protein